MLIDFLTDNGWTRLADNPLVNQIGFIKNGWLVNIVNDFASVRRFNRTMIASKQAEVLGYLQAANV